MLAADGKMRLTDVATTEQLFRLIQSVPSPKAEPFKLRMAQVAKERFDQMQDPGLSIEQTMTDYKRLGYSDNWINQRLKSRILQPYPSAFQDLEIHSRLFPLPHSSGSFTTG